MSNKIPSVNLYKGRGKSFIDRFLGWALTFGRLIVVLTEIIALSAFLYRFTLDREIIDLHGEIRQKQAMVKYLKNNEDKYRNLQERLAMASSLEKTSQETTKLLKDIVELAPKDFIFSNLIVSDESVRINANIFSVSSLTSYIKTLKTYPKVQAVSLDRIENKTSSAMIVASLRVTFKK